MSIAKATHSTPVPNSPVKKEVHQSEPHSNKATPFDPVSNCSTDLPRPKMGKRTATNHKAPAQNKKKKFQSGKKRRPKRHSAPLLPSFKKVYETLTQWVYHIVSVFSHIRTKSPNASWGFLILMAALITQTQAAPSPTHSPSSILSSLQPSPYRTGYPLLEMETRTWAYQI